MAFILRKTFVVIFCQLLLKMDLSQTEVNVDKSAKSSLQNKSDYPPAKWLEYLFPSEYNNEWPPGLQEAMELNKPMKDVEPTTIWTQLVPQSVTSIALITMDFETELLVQLSWYDSRLQNPSNFTRNPEAIIPNVIAKNLWIPWFKFLNCRACQPNLVDPAVNLIQFKWENTIGSVNVEFRKIYRFTCAFDLTLYPFDTQHCNAILQLRRHQHYLKLMTSIISEDMMVNVDTPPEFLMEGFMLSLINCTTAMKKLSNAFTNDCYILTFTFRRIVAQHIMLTYVPSILLVVLSWIAFWLDTDTMPPRIALALTLLLTLSTLFNNAQSKLPAVASIKALDIWMFTCIFMVFASLMVSAFSNCYYRRMQAEANCSEQKVTPKSVTKLLIPFRKYVMIRKNSKVSTLQKIETIKFPKIEKAKSPLRKNPKIIDKAARMFFPLFFLCFNIVYWCYYQT